VCFRSSFSFNTIVMDDGSDEHIFNTLCNNLRAVSLQLIFQLNLFELN
jgi:hypothetical protein